ncbi:MAG TPA: hypothetical protein VN229_23580, partial [Terriglobales bacterium]|nr:hypothetical protein [Terriglobales bacterium]
MTEIASATTADRATIAVPVATGDDTILQADADRRIRLSVLLIPGFALGDLARVVDTLTTANDHTGRTLFTIETIGLVP